MSAFSLIEFFAGAGMARAGLGAKWPCVFANDIDAQKGASYAANWGNDGLMVCDVARLTTDDIPAGFFDLAWGSPACKRISLAGRGVNRQPSKFEDPEAFEARRREGLGDEAWAWLALMQALKQEGRGPRLIVIENVEPLLTVNAGEDIDRICDTLTGMGYRYGCVVIDAELFVPQSRERLFIIAVDQALAIPTDLISPQPMKPFHPYGLIAVMRRQRSEPIWFKLPMPPTRTTILVDVLEDDSLVVWDTPAATMKLIGGMAELHRAKLDDMRRAGQRLTRSLNYRTRPTKVGRNIRKVPCWEICDAKIANCVRTGSGGSSTQRLLVVDGDSVRTRRITPREEARLMGLSDTFKLPALLGDSHDLVGDGVVVPVVRHIAEHILEPILEPILAASEINFPIEGIREAEAPIIMDTHHSGYDRNPYDFYIEDDWCLDALIAIMGRGDFEAGVYDPCCGIGTILAGAQRFKLRGIGSDIVDHRPPDGPFKLPFKFAGLRDFLNQGERPGVWPSMVFNPPYRLAQAFIEKALRETKPGGVVAALLPASFRYSQERYEFFRRREIERIISISKRPSMPDGDALIAGTVKRGGGKTNYD